MQQAWLTEIYESFSQSQRVEFHSTLPARYWERPDYVSVYFNSLQFYIQYI